MGQTGISNKDLMAISEDDFVEFGCPYCGFTKGNIHHSNNRRSLWDCNRCKKHCVILAAGRFETVVKITGKSTRTFVVELQDHPLRLMLEASNDTHIKEPGEYSWRPLYLDMVVTPGCFVCGGSSKAHRAILGSTTGVEEADSLASLLPFGCCRYLLGDVPAEIIVAIGACPAHQMNLKHIFALARANDNVISLPLLTVCRSANAKT